MTTTTPPPDLSTSTEQEPTTPTAPSRPSSLSRLAGPLALAGGSILGAAGMALHLPAKPEEADVPLAIAADPGLWMASHLLIAFGFALLAAGAVSILPRHRGRGAIATSVGALLTAAGATVMALGDMAHGAVGFALTEVDTATSLAVHAAYFESPAVLGLNMGPLLLPLGMIVLGSGLLRAGRHPRWVGILVIVAPLAVHATFAIDAPTVVRGLPIALAMTVLAAAKLRE